MTSFLQFPCCCLAEPFGIPVAICSSCFISWEYGLTSSFFLLPPPPPGPNWGRLSSAASGPQETPECLCPEELWECRWLRLQSSYSAIPDHPEPLSRKQMAGLGSRKCRGAPLRMAEWTHLNPQEWGGGDYYQGNSSF